MTEATKPKILVVEDSPDVSELVSRGLTEEGFEVRLAKNGKDGLRELHARWDLVVLDLMLPDVPGETLLSFITQRIDAPPVLVLTAKGSLTDKVTLFEQGCDDYLTKPFAFEELLGRVKALLRRSIRVNQGPLELDGLTLNQSASTVSFGNRTTVLTPKELALCRLLIQAQGEVVTRRELIRAVWGHNFDPKTNAIEVHINHLRKKLGEVGLEGWVRTHRGTGFSLSRPKD